MSAPAYSNDLLSSTGIRHLGKDRLPAAVGESSLLSRNLCSAAGTKRRSQVTGHRSQVTENAIKKLDTLLGFLCLFICCNCGYVTIRHICLAAIMLPVVLRVKEINIESHTLHWNLKSSFSRSDSWRPRNEAFLLHYL